jgi:two-component system, OmpR family, response regulator
MLPKTLALIDDDVESTQTLSQHLRDRGVDVHVCADAEATLADAEDDVEFYVVDLRLSDTDLARFIDRLRQRSDAGILVMSYRPGADVFAGMLRAGADMVLVKPVPVEQVALVIEAVHRRVARPGRSDTPWRLDRDQRRLIAPDGVPVALSEFDLTVLDCFIQAGGGTVTRETLLERLGRTPEGGISDGLNATIYRLRRRIERATPMLVPLQSKSRVGYVFKAPLRAI